MKLLLRIIPLWAILQTVAATGVSEVEQANGEDLSLSSTNRRSLRFSSGDGNEFMATVMHRALQAPLSSCPNVTIGSGSNAKRTRASYVVNTLGSAIVVDGNPQSYVGEWNLDVAGPDFVSYMFNAGNANSGDSNFDRAGRLYLRWNCANRKLCALILTEAGRCINPTDPQAFFKDYVKQNSEIDADSPGIVLVPQSGLPKVGWEGCFSPYTNADSVCRGVVEFHAEYGLCGGSLGSTASSGRSGYLGLDLNCSNIPPTPPPTQTPSAKPSRHPSAKPSRRPSSKPSRRPSTQPSDEPSKRPSNQPSDEPSNNPSTSPSSMPSRSPSKQPSEQPSNYPSTSPSSKPSSHPSKQPSEQPSNNPSTSPSNAPSITPSYHPSSKPSTKPSEQPSRSPTKSPTKLPTLSPTRICTDTAWAVWNKNMPKLNCLNTLPGLSSDKWGWYFNVTSGYSAVHKIYSGAGQCDLTKGTFVGKLTVEYFGGKVLITVPPPIYGFYAVIHYYIGTTPLPRKNGQFTAAPGNFDKAKSPAPGATSTYQEDATASLMHVAVHLEWSRAC